MYVLLVALMLCVYFYTNKIRNSKISSKFWQYPTCYTEVPILGNLYKFVDGPKCMYSYYENNCYENTKYFQYKKYINEEFKKAVTLLFYIKLIILDFFKILFKICKRTCELGGVSRINGFNSHYLDIADVEEILKFYLDKDYLYNILQVLSGGGSVFNLDASESKVRRQLLLPAFSSRMLANYAEDICNESTRLIEELAQHAGSGPFRGDNYFSTFCLSCNLRIGKVLEIEKEIKLTEEIVEKHRTSFILLTKRFFSVWRHSDFLYRFTSDFRRLKKYKLGFDRYADRVQDIRKQQLEAQETREYGIFDGLIKKLSRREINEEIIVVSGTSEEPGLTIGYVLTLLSQYPSVQKKVYEELIEVFGDSDRPSVREDLLKMRYLNMVIKEALRLFPPVPLIFRKAHEEITLSSGRVIPAGVSIAVPIICIQRDPQYWGADAKHFDPERFLPERLQGLPSNAFLPFSRGARGCPGYELGIYMVKAAVSSILRKYKIVERPASGPVPNIETKFELSLKPVNNFEIEIIKRI